MAEDQAFSARGSDFSGGHWGRLGARRAAKNQWGGVNMMLTPNGTLAPASASRPFRFDNLSVGEILGVFWAWGLDERVYFVQRTDGDTCQIRRFLPSLVNPAIPIEDVGAVVGPVTRLPDWTILSGSLYVTFFAHKTYVIDPVANTRTVLNNVDAGDAPGGRAICVYGERLLIGGVNDARFTGLHGNRVVYSEAAEPANMGALNFFDVGADTIEIAGLYPVGPRLYVLLSDQQAWRFAGTPGDSDSLARAFGPPKGTGGITIYTHDNGFTDPAQTHLWLFDHTVRGPARLAGTQFDRVPAFGVPSPDRTGSGRLEGKTVAIGGPNEFIMDRVTMPRTDAVGPSAADLELVRLSNAYALVERDVLTGRT